MPDELTFERAGARIERFMLALTVLGTAVSLAAGGWRWAAGFLVGAFISGINFRWLRRLVTSLSGTASRSSILLAFRYLFLAGIAYAILRYTPVVLTAVLTGLFVMTAAVFVEVLFELLYGRK